jgi:hypothetical protein
MLRAERRRRRFSKIAGPALSWSGHLTHEQFEDLVDLFDSLPMVNGEGLIYSPRYKTLQAYSLHPPKET